MQNEINIMGKLIEIRRASYSEAKQLKEFDEFIGDRRINNSRGELFVAFYNNELAGFITYSSAYFFDRPFIQLLCVKKEFRRKGIARELMLKVAAVYEEIDLWTSTEEWNVAAENLFISLGFVKCGTIQGINKDNIEEVFFIKYGKLQL